MIKIGLTTPVYDCVGCCHHFNDIYIRPFIWVFMEKKFEKHLQFLCFWFWLPPPAAACGGLCLSGDTYRLENCWVYLHHNDKHKWIRLCDDITCDAQRDQCSGYNGRGGTHLYSSHDYSTHNGSNPHLTPVTLFTVVSLLSRRNLQLTKVGQCGSLCEI